VSRLRFRIGTLMVAVAAIGLYLAGWVRILRVPDSDRGSDWAAKIVVWTMVGALSVSALLALGADARTKSQSKLVEGQQRNEL
jgi:hypothetical protein